MQVNQRRAGVIISYAGQMVHILTGFIYTPVMLRLLGKSEYGLYQLVYSVVSYLSLLSLGFSASYMRFYSRERLKEDEKSVPRLNGMFMIIFSIISMICILCGIVMIINIKHIFGDGLTNSEYSTARILMALLVVNLALTFPNSVFNCIITSQERFLFQKSLMLAHYIMNPFLTLPLLIMGYGSVGMVLVTTFLTFAVLITNIYYCVKNKYAKFCFKGLQFSLLKEMWTFTFFIFLNQIIDQINWSVDKFLLGRLAGTSAVAVYGVGGQINTLYVQFSGAVSNVFVPKVNNIVAENDDNKALSEIFIKVGRIQFIIMSFILSGFIFFGRDFVKLWAGNGYSEAYFVTLLLIIPVTVPLIQNLGIEIQRAKNKHKARSVVYFVIAIANIGISIPLIKLLGPTGAALGTAIALVVGNVLFMNWYYMTKLGIDIPLFWKNIASFAPGLVLPIMFGVVYMLLISNGKLIVFGICTFVYAIIFCASIFKLGMNNYEKSIINGIVKRKIKRG